MIKIYNKNSHKPEDFRTGTILKLRGTNHYVKISKNPTTGKKTLRFAKKPTEKKPTSKKYESRGGARVHIPSTKPTTTLGAFFNRINPFASDTNPLQCGFSVNIDLDQVKIPTNVKFTKVDNKFYVPETLNYKSIEESTSPTENCNALVTDYVLSYNDSRSLEDARNADGSYSFIYNYKNDDFLMGLWVYFATTPQTLTTAKKSAAFSNYLCQNEDLLELISPYRMLTKNIAIQNISNGRLSDLAKILSTNEIVMESIKSIFFDLFRISNLLKENKFYCIDTSLDDYNYFCNTEEENLTIKLAVLETLYSPKAKLRNTKGKLQALDKINYNTSDELQHEVAFNLLKLFFKFLENAGMKKKNRFTFENDKQDQFIDKLNELLDKTQNDNHKFNMENIEDLFQ